VGLSEDQKAMLRLLAQREQGYEDIAALMGLSVEQVRERVKDALAQLEQEKAEAPAAPAEEPRGAGPVAQGGASSSQAAGEAPPSTPPAPEATSEETAEVQAVPLEPEGPAVPVEQEPVASPKGSEVPAAEAASAAEVPREPKVSRSGPPRVSLPEGNGARAAIAAGVGAVIVLVVVLIVGGGGGGSSSGTTASGANTGTSAEEGEPTSTGGSKQLTKAVLEPVGGSSASGVAIFGRVKKALALQVEAEGLNPTAKGHSYTVWLAASPQKMLPLASTAVAKDGRIGAQFEVPAEVLAYLANESFGQIVITETEDSALKASLKKATGEKKAPAYTGTAVLEGTVTGPIVGAAKREK
jgi:hypothetical protein